MQLQRNGRISFYKPALFWFFVSLVVRFTAGAAIHLYSHSAGYNGFVPLAAGADDAGYFNLATEILAGRADQLEWIPTSYPYMLAGLFAVSGESLVAGKLLNVFFASWTIYFAVLLTRRLQIAHGSYGKNESPSWRSLSSPVNLTGLALTFYPSALFYASQMTKDTLLVFFGVLFIFLLVRAMQQKRFASWALVLIPFAGLADFRAYALLSLMAGFALWLVVQPGLLRRHAGKIAIIGLVSIPIISVLVEPYRHYFNLETLASFRNSSYTGGSSVGITLDFTNPLTFCVSYAYNFVTVLFGPFPWQVQSEQHLIALVEAIPMYLFIPLILSRMITSLLPSSRHERLLFLMAMLQIASFALLSDNLGTNARLRILSWSCLIIHFSITLRPTVMALRQFFSGRVRIPEAQEAEKICVEEQSPH
jgi:hypothetical protein